MFCENCGSRLSDDSKFCENCGTKVERYYEEPTSKEESFDEEPDLKTEENYDDEIEFRTDDIDEELDSQEENYDDEIDFQYDDYDENLSFKEEDSTSQVEQTASESQNLNSNQPVYSNQEFGYSQNNTHNLAKKSGSKGVNKKFIFIGAGLLCVILVAVVATIMVISNINKPVKKGYQLYLNVLASELNITVEQLEELDLVDDVYCVYQDDIYYYKLIIEDDSDDTEMTLYFKYDDKKGEIGTTSTSIETEYEKLYFSYEQGIKGIKFKEVI